MRHFMLVRGRRLISLVAPRCSSGNSRVAAAMTATAAGCWAAPAAAAASAAAAAAAATDSTLPVWAEDHTIGDGAEVTFGCTAHIHYEGRTEGWDGPIFDSTWQRAAPPLIFRAGYDSAIKGLHQGVTGMRVGGRRKLTVPAELAYGAKGAAREPPSSCRLSVLPDLACVAQSLVFPHCQALRTVPDRAGWSHLMLNCTSVWS